MKTQPVTVILREVRILGTGMDGGHTYIFGRAEHPPHGTVDAYAYFDFEDRPNEAEFEVRYTGGDLEVQSASWDYYPSTGLSLHNITWKNVDSVAAREV